MGNKKSELQQIVGAAIIAIVSAAIVVGAVYGLTGTVSAGTLRWWATLATLAAPIVIVITWRLATKAAREHLTGFNRGLDGAERTMQSVGRGLSATASMARAAKSQPAPTPAVRFDDLLPRPKGSAPITIRKPEDDEIVL